MAVCYPFQNIANCRSFKTIYYWFGFGHARVLVIYIFAFHNKWIYANKDIEKKKKKTENKAKSKNNYINNVAINNIIAEFLSRPQKTVFSFLVHMCTNICLVLYIYLSTFIIDKYYIYRRVTAIVVGTGHGKPSSNPRQGISHNANILWKVWI